MNFRDTKKHPYHCALEFSCLCCGEHPVALSLFPAVFLLSGVKCGIMTAVTIRLLSVHVHKAVGHQTVGEVKKKKKMRGESCPTVSNKTVYTQLTF